MPAPRFVHLRLHSEYSIVDGTVRIDQAIARAGEDAMPALALTDLSNVFGLVKFYQEARSRGVKPILGCDAWIANDADRERPSRALLLCQTRDGYRRLCELLTRAYRSNQHRNRAELRKEWLRELGTDGLIALSGAMQGETSIEAFEGLGTKKVVQAHPVWRREQRQLALAQLDLGTATLRDLHGVAQGGGNVREQPRHLLLALEVLLGREVPRSALVGEHVALADAHARFVCLEVFLSEKLNGMGCDHRQAHARGELRGGTDVCLLVGMAHALQLDVEALGEELRP